MANTITKTTETEQYIALNNDSTLVGFVSHQANECNIGIWPIIRGIQAGWIIPPGKPGEGLPPAEITFTCELSTEEALQEIRGN